jgi:hypothetical protein
VIRLLWAVSAHIRYYLRRYMPSNRLIDAIRTRQGLKWGVPAMLLAAPYFAAAYGCTVLLAHHGPGWLNLVILICVWSGLKMLWIGPVSLVLLARARAREAHARRTQGAAEQDECDAALVRAGR